MSKYSFYPLSLIVGYDFILSNFQKSMVRKPSKVLVGWNWSLESQQCEKILHNIKFIICSYIEMKIIDW